MKTIRHTINVPGQMEELLNQRIQDFRSLSGYFVSLGFTDVLYLPKRPIAKAFANASWQQQKRAIENVLTLRKHGWRGLLNNTTCTIGVNNVFDLQPPFVAGATVATGAAENGYDEATANPKGRFWYVALKKRF